MMTGTKTSNIWVDLPNKKAVQIGSRSELRRWAEQLREETLRDEEKNREFLRWFLTQSPNKAGTETQVRQKLDTLFAGEFPDRASVARWLTGSRLEDFFQYLETENAEPYLSDSKGEFHAPGAFLSDAARAVEYLPADVQGAAMARLSMNCMALSRLPSQLPPALRKAMLSPWKQPETAFFRELKNGETFFFHWTELPGDTVPQRRILTNGEETAKQLRIRAPEYGEITLSIPPGGRITAWFRGDTMINFKGSLFANGTHVGCLMQEKLWQYETKWQSTRLTDAQDYLDAALYSNGRPHLLVGQMATLLGAGAPRKVSGATGIWAQEDVWVVYREDGSTMSNCEQLRKQQVLAAVWNGQTILLLTEGGAVTALNGGSYTPEDVWNALSAPFKQLPEGCAEQLVHGGQTFRYLQTGKMLCP